MVWSSGAAIGPHKSSCVDKSVDKNGGPIGLTVAGCAVVYPIGTPVAIGGESGPPPAKLTPSIASASRSNLATRRSAHLGDRGRSYEVYRTFTLSILPVNGNGARS